MAKKICETTDPSISFAECTDLERTISLEENLKPWKSKKRKRTKNRHRRSEKESWFKLSSEVVSDDFNFKNPETNAKCNWSQPKIRITPFVLQEKEGFEKISKMEVAEDFNFKKPEIIPTRELTLPKPKLLLSPLAVQKERNDKIEEKMVKIQSCSVSLYKNPKMVRTKKHPLASTVDLSSLIKTTPNHQDAERVRIFTSSLKSRMIVPNKPRRLC